VGVAVTVHVRSGVGVNHRQSVRSTAALVPVLTFLYPSLREPAHQYVRGTIQVPESARMALQPEYNTLIGNQPIWPDRVASGIDCLGELEYGPVLMKLGVDLVASVAATFVTAKYAQVNLSRQGVSIGTANRQGQLVGQPNAEQRVQIGVYDRALGRVVPLKELQVKQSVSQYQNQVRVTVGGGL
jgi:hypothetical protein